MTASHSHDPDTAALRAVLHVLFERWCVSLREAAGVLGCLDLRTLFERGDRTELHARQRSRNNGDH